MKYFVIPTKAVNGPFTFDEACDFLRNSPVPFEEKTSVIVGDLDDDLLEILEEED
jgi:hypothetical protein